MSNKSSSAAENVVPPGCVRGESNPRGILCAFFIEDVEEYLKSHSSVDAALNSLNEIYRDYKYVEEQVTMNKASYEKKIPDIEKNIKIINYLETQQEMENIITQFELSDHLFATASINKPQSVCLWLGADVMLEYPINEAKELLETNVGKLKENLEKSIEDLEFLKSQMTTVEVNIVRVYNYDVKKRRSQKK
eukprot:TRINITY_DN1440_c0_g1_i2.p1 TRINITY_DN1440_c0_g1~~TRINITY_DN1440_c0_g1_i2.p1  ORF type:complete len:206 (+),score=69.57 TRINITY_DN1440_c0_g1_i2:43-618(+)